MLTGSLPAILILLASPLMGASVDQTTYDGPFEVSTIYTIPDFL